MCGGGGIKGRAVGFVLLCLGKAEPWGGVARREVTFKIDL